MMEICLDLAFFLFEVKRPCTILLAFLCCPLTHGSKHFIQVYFFQCIYLFIFLKNSWLTLEQKKKTSSGSVSLQSLVSRRLKCSGWMRRDSRGHASSRHLTGRMAPPQWLLM